jgi:membrane protease YdiL (CAAX protease family)
MRLLKQFVAVALVALAGNLGIGLVQGNTVLTLVIGVATAVLAMLTYRWAVRWSERRTPVEVAAEGAAGAAGRGVLIGLGMFAAVIVNIAFMGGYRVDGLGSVTGAVALLGFMAAAAVTEELLFRGVLFRIIEERLGTWISLTLTSLVFGAMHLFNKDATLWGAVAIAIEAGAMLAAAYAATRTLWLPIGLHFGWNFAAAGIFSTEVSGNGASQGLLHSVTSGPSLLTGGDFGPEASPYAVVFGLALTVVFLWLARRRGNLVPMRRGARADATATLTR